MTPASRPSLDLLPGTVALFVLKTLSWGPRHGYGISSWIRQQTDGQLGLEDAALYQSLHRLERQGLVRSEWGLSERNRRAKYYALTRAGRARLAVETSTWQRYAAAVFQLLDAAPQEG